MKTEKITNSLGELSDMLESGEGKSMDGMFNTIKDTVESAKNYHIAGPEGVKSGEDFDESGSIVGEQKEPAGILIRCGDIIDGIRVLYTDGKMGSMHGSTFGGSEHVIRFEPGDSLASIEGRKGIPFGGGQSLAGIKIKTVKGKTYGPFGGSRRGTPFKLEIPREGSFKGLCGNVGKGGNGGYLAQLGLIYYMEK